MTVERERLGVHLPPGTEQNDGHLHGSEAVACRGYAPAFARGGKSMYWRRFLGFVATQRTESCRLLSAHSIWASTKHLKLHMLYSFELIQTELKWETVKMAKTTAAAKAKAPAAKTKAKVAAPAAVAAPAKKPAARKPAAKAKAPAAKKKAA